MSDMANLLEWGRNLSDFGGKKNPKSFVHCHVIISCSQNENLRNSVILNVKFFQTFGKIREKQVISHWLCHDYEPSLFVPDTVLLSIVDTLHTWSFHQVVFKLFHVDRAKLRRNVHSNQTYALVKDWFINDTHVMGFINNAVQWWSGFTSVTHIRGGGTHSSCRQRCG